MSYWDDDDDRGYDDREPWCNECGLDHPDGEHKIWCSAAAPTTRVRFYRAWHWHVMHWRTPSLYMIWMRWKSWRIRRAASKAPIVDDDIPF